MKRFKTKKNKSYRSLFIIIVSFVVFIMLFIYLSHFKLEKSYASFINYLYSDIGFSKEKEKEKSPINSIIGNLDFLISDYIFYEEDEVLVTTKKSPKIYIYNTHDTETYKENNDYNIKATVITASYMLKDALSRLNVSSVVEERRVSDYLSNKSYSDSYKVSRTFLEDSVINNSNYEYFIDIHRDSVSKKHTQIVIDNKEYARIMFVLGLENENFQENKYLMSKLNDYLNKFYPGLSRGIYEKSGKGVNGVYNQDFHPNTMLIEVGGVDSNLNSVFNSTEIIARALYDVIGDLNEESY